jgi:hypothetical protein
MMVSEQDVQAVQQPFRLTDVWPALSRVAAGFLVVPLFSRLTNGDTSASHLWLFFLAVLAALKVVPAVLRKLMPVSQETKAHWFKLRVIAKRYDSYQWRKLLWIGLGLVAYAVVRGGVSPAQGLLGAVSIVAGSLGEYAWRRALRTDRVLQAELR